VGMAKQGCPSFIRRLSSSPVQFKPSQSSKVRGNAIALTLVVWGRGFATPPGGEGDAHGGAFERVGVGARGGVPSVCVVSPVLHKAGTFQSHQPNHGLLNPIKSSPICPPMTP
jgi:hypothetical protein